MEKNTNIIIVGAGLVGLSTALALKNLGYSITVVEHHLPATLTAAKTDTRPLSLSFGSHRILQALGVWETIAKTACPILSVHISEKKQFGFTCFSAQEENVPALGFVVPFAALHMTLYQLVTAEKNINLLPIQSIEKIHCGQNGVVIDIQTASKKESLHADLLIAADGTKSTCRALLNMGCHEKNTKDIARIYQLSLSAPHDHTAYERFTKWGVLAILPLFEKKSAQLVWTMTPHQAKKIALFDDKKTAAFLQDTFFERLSIQTFKKSAEFPLQTVIAEKQVTEAAVLLGNAAHTIYPLAAQGFNLALNDVAALAEVITDACHLHQPINALSTLKKYEDAVQNNQNKIIRMTQSLVTVFDLPMMGCARGLGLLATDLITPIKHQLAKRAMGMATRLSKIYQTSSQTEVFYKVD